MNRFLKTVLVGAAFAFTGTTASQAATFGFEAVAGGEMDSESVTIVGDANGFTAFGFSWSMTATESPASADASKQEFIPFPVPGVTTTLALSMVEQMFSSDQYTGLFKVVTDLSGLWGDYALIEVTAPSLDGFGQGSLQVTEAAKTVNPIPLPAGAWLLLTGLVGLTALRRTIKA